MAKTNSFDRMEISNAKLRLDQVPSEDADWPAIWEFALSFDGYAHWAQPNNV